jgi:LemA protein
MTPLIVAVALLVLLALVASASYNSLVRARNDVKNGWNQIDVQLLRRHDLVPNLVETVKGFAKHERELL